MFRVRIVNSNLPKYNQNLLCYVVYEYEMGPRMSLQRPTSRPADKSSAHILGDVSDLIKSLRSFATREAEWHRAFAL